MKRALGILAGIVFATLVVAAPAHGEEPTRESYVAQLEPMCEANAAANKRIMAGAKERLSNGKMVLAGKQFIRVSQSFGSLVKKIAAVSPPAADAKPVQTWIKFLRLLKQRLRTVGKYFKEEERIKANHESIQAERSGNSANNTVYEFGFHHCRIKRFR
ncbi:MAG: hypothetical protein WD827_06485 [Solirubrobacterales bacterium]